MENNEEKELSIEEASLQKYPLKSPTDRGHTMNWDYECHNKNMRQAFIAGANHILSSKGLVEREAIVEVIKNRIKDIEGNGHTVITVERARELTDLINKINSL